MKNQDIAQSQWLSSLIKMDDIQSVELDRIAIEAHVLESLITPGGSAYITSPLVSEPDFCRA